MAEGSKHKDNRATATLVGCCDYQLLQVSQDALPVLEPEAGDFSPGELLR